MHALINPKKMLSTIIPIIMYLIIVILRYYFLFLPVIAFKTALPILRSMPNLVVGMLVFLATFVFNPLTPIARLRENDKPGIFIN